MAERAFHHALRRHAAVFRQNLLLDRAGIDADAHRNVMRLDTVRQNAHVLFSADVARIDAQLVDTVFHSGQRKLVIKVNIRHQRHGTAVHQRTDSLRACLVVHRDADDIRAGNRQRTDLRERRLHIRRIGIGHGLHGNRRAPADEHAAGSDLSCQLRHDKPSFIS